MKKQQTRMLGPEVMLTIWGDQINHTVTELFVVLARYCCDDNCFSNTV